MFNKRETKNKKKNKIKKNKCDTEQQRELTVAIILIIDRFEYNKHIEKSSGLSEQRIDNQ